MISEQEEKSTIIFEANKVTIDFEDGIEEKIETFIQHKGNLERAGALIGRLFPRSNKIRIVDILEADYKTRTTHYVETNERRLNDKIYKEWKNSNGCITYIGEWHTHPEEYPSPSDLDIQTSYDKFHGSKFDQNILIDMIVGQRSKRIAVYDGKNFYKPNIVSKCD